MVSNKESTYCQIYVDTNLEHDALLTVIQTAIGGELERNTISTPEIDVYIDRNDSFDEVRRKEFPDGFLYFRYVLDMDTQGKELWDSYISFITKVLETCWSSGFKAVAACDFESRLPHDGGYKWQGNKYS